MSDSKITLIGCDNYFNNIGQSVFDFLSLPEGLTKQTLTDTILLRGGEFEVISGNPEFIRFAVGSWSSKWMPTMERWVRALAIDYNPLENYDRMEDWTDDTDGSEAGTVQNTSHRDISSDTDRDASEATTVQNTSHRDISSDTEGSSSGAVSESKENRYDRDSLNSPPTHETLKSAYDSSNYSPVQKDIDTGKWKETGTMDSSNAQSNSEHFDSDDDYSNREDSSNAQSSIEHFDSDDDYSNREDSSNARSVNSVHNGRIHGNIGVTTSQQMLEQELLLGYWNIYEKIAEIFLQEFTIPVYV